MRATSEPHSRNLKVNIWFFINSQIRTCCKHDLCFVYWALMKKLKRMKLHGLRICRLQNSPELAACIYFLFNIWKKSTWGINFNSASRTLKLPITFCLQVASFEEITPFEKIFTVYINVQSKLATPEMPYIKHIVRIIPWRLLPFIISTTLS